MSYEYGCSVSSGEGQGTKVCGVDLGGMLVIISGVSRSVSFCRRLFKLHIVAELRNGMVVSRKLILRSMGM